MKLLNKPPFRRGDVVRCVVPYPPEDLMEGQHFTVQQIAKQFGAWMVDIGDGQGIGWDSIRFVKVSEENNSETVELQ